MALLKHSKEADWSYTLFLAHHGPVSIHSYLLPDAVIAGLTIKHFVSCSRVKDSREVAILERAVNKGRLNVVITVELVRARCGVAACHSADLLTRCKNEKTSNP